MSNKRGKFNITRQFIERNPDLVKEIMGHCIIVRAELLYHADAVEYHAECDLFEELDDGFIAPEYMWQIHLSDDGNEATLILPPKKIS